MLQQTRQFLALYLSTALLLAGHGLQLTLLPLRADGLGWDATAVGLTGTAYFAGFLAGCLLVPRFVAAVGHIRVFSAATTVCGLALLGVLVFADVPSWMVLRFATGLGISGCYIVIESWLNDRASDANRGRTLAFYTMLVLTAMVLGQLAVPIAPPVDAEPVVLGVALLSLAVLPLSLIRMQQPRRPRTARTEIRRLAREAPAAFLTPVLAGLVTSALYALLPVLAIALGYDALMAVQLMMAMILGGAALQYPAGKLSDRVDRRYVLLLLGVLGAAAAALSLWATQSEMALIVAVFLLGGAANALYPVCLSHANDRIPMNFLSVGTSVLMLNSFGAVAGPTLFAAAMDGFGGQAFFLLVAALFGVVVLWTLLCLVRRSEAASHDADFVPVVRSSTAAFELDPRSSPDWKDS